MEYTPLDIIWLTISAGLVFLMQAGFTCLESGLTRSKNSINVAIKNISDFGVSVCLFWLLGFWLMFDFSPGSWISWGSMPELDSSWRAAFFLFQVMFCGTAVTIVSGAVAERVRFWSYLIAVCLVSGFLYPVFGNWAWGGIGGEDPGWLKSLGFQDFAGSTVVHSLGGWVALAFAVVVGPREGRFPEKGPPKSICGHNLPLAVLGTLLLWFGWLGFNGGSTYQADPRVPMIVVKTVIAGAAGLLTGLLGGWVIHRRADVLCVINGSLAGLVAITAGCDVVSLEAAAVIGAVGALCMLAADRLLEHWRIDDAVGATAVHAASGVWGTLAVGLFAPSNLFRPDYSRLDFLGIQLLGVVVCFAWAFGLSLAFFHVLNRYFPVRVTPQQERDGLNISEHGATTELVDLLHVMDRQATTGDISLRAPVEPFTEVGQIAGLYNRALDSLQTAVAQTDAIVRSASDAIITFTRRQQLVTSVNPSALVIFQGAAEQLIGQPFRSLLRNGDQSFNTDESAKTQHSTDSRLPEETVARRLDGTSFPAELTITPISANSEADYVATIRDISVRLRAQERLQTTVEAAPNAMLIVNAKGEIVMANRQTELLFGHERAELIHQSIELLVPGDVRGNHCQLREVYMKSPTPRAMGTGRDLRGVTKAGLEIPVEIGLAPIELNEGPCVIASIVDISARIRLADKMAEAQQAAEDANRAKSDFLANMSHDIRTPLNAIMGLTDLVLEMDLSPTQREYLSIAHESSESLLTIINEILDFSRIEAGRLELESIPFDLREEIGDALRSVAVKAHDKFLELAWHVDQDVPRMLLGDPSRLRQILVNLVGNAIKFTEEGEIVLSIHKTVQHNSRIRLHFSICDTGIGIPPEKVTTVFAPFEQADTSTTRQFEGTGLGLAIVSRIVEAMQGKIWVESQLGQGSTFQFECEFLQAMDLPPKAILPRPNLAGIPIVVLDDNSTNRLILREILASWGMQVQTAENGLQAIEALLSQIEAGIDSPLLLSDIHMPNMDGFELAEKIRSHKTLRGTTIILLTSGIRQGDIARFQELGVQVHLMKPVKPSELLETLWKTLGENIEMRDEDSPEGMKLRPLKILLVEDGHANQKLATALLEKWGHEVVLAENGSIAVEAWNRDSFDAILMDVQMPVMDGFEATREIRRQEGHTQTHIPIIAMTARAMKGDRELCLQAGMDAYISKPIHREDFFQILTEFFAVDSRSNETSSRTEIASEDSPGLIHWNTAWADSDHDESILRVVIKATIEELPELQAALNQQYAAGHAREVQRLAHTIKAAGRTFGVEPLIQLASEIESQATQSDLANLQLPITKLCQLSQSLLRELQLSLHKNVFPK